jgi:hypothetical protein
MKTKITFEQGCQMVYFQTKNPKFGYILEDLAMEDVCAFYGRLVYFTAILYILWPFGIFYGYLVYLFRFGMLCQEKSGNPVQELVRITAYSVSRLF